MTTCCILNLAAGLTQVLADNDYFYLYGNGRIAQYSTRSGFGNDIDYFLTDALGSVRQLVNQKGEVTLAKAYEPFGETLESAGDGESAFAYAGEAVEAMTGYVYLRARFMNPAVGRFTSRDVWQGDYYQPMSYNAWLYGFANPVRFIDPTGELPLLKFERDPEPRQKHNVWITANYWKETEKNAAEQAAYDVGEALARTINTHRFLLKATVGIDRDPCSYPPLNPLSPSLAFLLVYGGQVTFMHITDSSAEALAQTQNQRLVYIYKNYENTPDYAAQHPGWIVHELGHAFEHALSPGAPWNSPGRLGLPDDLLVRTLDDPTDPDPNAGFAGRFEEWQYSQNTGRGEIFADMFLGWVYNTWAVNVRTGRLTDMAQDRADYMQRKMPILIYRILEQ